MHERKRKMFEHADAFVALPGGIGTLEEVVEQLTWAQLGQHKKPILLANINGYWDPLLSLIAHMRKQEFLPASPRVECHVANRVEDILPKLPGSGPRCDRKRKRNGGRRPRGCSPAIRIPQKRHRFDPVAVPVADKGGIIVRGIFKPHPRRAVGVGTGGEPAA